MAAAAEPGGLPWKRSSSLELLPPYMSELRVVVLGSSWIQRNSVENFILEHSVFNTEPLSCTRNTSRFRNEHVTVINTPDLLSPTEDKLNKFLKDFARVSDPGPHVFLLVLHPEDFNEEHKQTLCRLLETYNHQSFDRCLALVTPREESSGLRETHMENPTLKEMIRKCRYRHLKMSDIDRSELLTHLGQVVKENNGEHLTYGVFEETTSPALGTGATASGTGASASGTGASASGTGASASSGKETGASSSGTGATASGTGGTASGTGASASGTGASASSGKETVSSSSADSNREFFDMDGKEVKPGDLIHISRGYQHWAVYVGDGNVVHFVPPGEGLIHIPPMLFESCSISSSSSTVIDVGDISDGKVLKEKLQDVVKKDKWTVINFLDHEYKPRPADVIVKEACSLVDTEKQYHPVRYDSGDFATEMRYGKPESRQVRMFATRIKPAAAEVEAAAASGLKKRKRSSKLSSSSADSNREFFDMDGKEVKPGDLIQVYPDDWYYHWAVYVGDGDVVHFVPTREGSSSSSSMEAVEAMASSSSMSPMSSVGLGDISDGKVLNEKLQDVVEDNYWIVNNLLDHEYKPRPADDIVKEACSLVDTEKQYNLVTYNSEHFATEMRYGKPGSRQHKDAGIKPLAAEVEAAVGTEEKDNVLEM
ncbi:uncharacterized protein LOC133442475 isoform X2 [Cololabis saira]|uniref:uncharacterized protein LOC133442475 isoform X2 n=1 Tax=Cololabis saira TaxID=129043 RepID=UPI002AD5088C|nr:uncharacterized protein LOC133442475 isoform X2 [Cololabis saira]